MLQLKVIIYKRIATTELGLAIGTMILPLQWMFNYSEYDFIQRPSHIDDEKFQVL